MGKSKCRSSNAVHQPLTSPRVNQRRRSPPVSAFHCARLHGSHNVGKLTTIILAVQNTECINRTCHQGEKNIMRRERRLFRLFNDDAAARLLSAPWRHTHRHLTAQADAEVNDMSCKAGFDKVRLQSRLLARHQWRLSQPALGPFSDANVKYCGFTRKDHCIWRSQFIISNQFH